MDPLSTLYAAGITPTLGADGLLHPIPDPLSDKQQPVWHSVREYVVANNLREHLVAAVRCGQQVEGLRGTVESLADELHACFHNLSGDLSDWTREPWVTWRRVLHDQEDRERYVPTPGELAGEMDRRASERAKLLALLVKAGPRGVLNSELTPEVVGKRYSARLEELRQEGHVIDTKRLSQREYRFVYVGRRLPEAA